MERQLYHEIAVSDGALQTAERQRRRRALTAAWLIVGGLYASIVACSVLVQSRAGRTSRRCAEDRPALGPP